MPFFEALRVSSVFFVVDDRNRSATRRRIGRSNFRSRNEGVVSRQMRDRDHRGEWKREKERGSVKITRFSSTSLCSHNGVWMLLGKVAKGETIRPWHESAVTRRGAIVRSRAGKRPEDVLLSIIGNRRGSGSFRGSTMLINITGRPQPRRWKLPVPRYFNDSPQSRGSYYTGSKGSY